MRFLGGRRLILPSLLKLQPAPQISSDLGAAMADPRPLLISAADFAESYLLADPEYLSVRVSRGNMGDSWYPKAGEGQNQWMSESVQRSFDGVAFSAQRNETPGGI